MFRFVSRISACAALAVCFFLSTAARAQDLTVTIPSFNDVKTKIDIITEKISPDYQKKVEKEYGAIGEILFSPESFGIDVTKPIAICANSYEDKGFSPACFIPVKKSNDLNKKFSGIKNIGGFDFLQTIGLLPNWKIKSKDDYSILCYHDEWLNSIPKFETPNTLNFKMKPRVLLPWADQQISETKLLKDDEIREAKLVNLERFRRNFSQLEDISVSIDVADSSDIVANFSVKPLEGTDIAGNYANSEQLDKSLLGIFYDEKAPFAAQFLGTFDENNRKDFVEFITSTLIGLPEELKEVILKAMEVQKFDLACSFYPDKLGVYGILAMGIANGDKINEGIEKAIDKIDPDSLVQGKANTGMIGGNVKLHEFTISMAGENKKFALAIHPRFLFLVVPQEGTKAVDSLKKYLKLLKQPSPVKQNAKVHFSMELLSSSVELDEDEEIDFLGEVNYVGKFSNGKFNGTVKIDGTLFETIGKINAAGKIDLDELGWGDGESKDKEDLFGDDDDNE